MDPNNETVKIERKRLTNMNTVEWSAGWDSYFVGLENSDNPHSKGTTEWERWDDGWFDAAYTATGGSRIC